LLGSIFKPEEEKFMRRALAYARRALAADEVPVGAVIVDARGEIIGGGRNSIEVRGCQIAHAEVIAIQKACRALGNWRLDGCWMYVTLEPCVMCYGLISLSRCAGVVYGATSPLFGIGLPGYATIERLHERLVIKGGLKEEESADILRLFFKKVREKEKKR
jgi:tRNA(adenine34) deaminase